jgi:hypothetical protein
VGHVSGKLAVKRHEHKAAPLEQEHSEVQVPVTEPLLSRPNSTASTAGSSPVTSVGVRAGQEEDLSLCSVPCRVGGEPPLAAMLGSCANGASAAFVKALPSHSSRARGSRGDGGAGQGEIEGSFAVVWTDGRICLCHITSRYRDIDFGVPHQQSRMIEWETVQCFHTKYVFHSISYYLSANQWEGPERVDADADSPREAAPHDGGHQHSHEHDSSSAVMSPVEQGGGAEAVTSEPVEDVSAALPSPVTLTYAAVLVADTADSGGGARNDDAHTSTSAAETVPTRVPLPKRARSMSCIGQSTSSDNNTPYIIATSLTGHSIFVSLLASDFNLDSAGSKPCSCFDRTHDSRQMLAFDSCHAFESSLCAGICQGGDDCPSLFCCYCCLTTHVVSFCLVFLMIPHSLV